MTERAPTVVAGERPSATKHNAISDAVNVITDRLDAGGILEDLAGESVLFYVTNVSGLVLKGIAGTLAPVGGETEFDILVPRELRTNRAGTTVTRTDVNNANATGASPAETWIVTPAYEVGDVVEAMLWEADGNYVDRNMGGRYWAAVI